MPALTGHKVSMFVQRLKSISVLIWAAKSTAGDSQNNELQTKLTDSPFYNSKNYVETLTQRLGAFLMATPNPWCTYGAPKYYFSLYSSDVERGSLHWNCSVARTNRWYYLINAQTFFCLTVKSYLPFVRHKGFENPAETEPCLLQTHHSCYECACSIRGRALKRY